MGLLDWIVLGLFFVALFGVVWWVLRQNEETSVDYFLAGRNAGVIAIGASIFASNIGSEHLVGLAGSGAETGMAMAPFELHAWIILILGWVFVPFYSRSKVFTMPEFLEKRYCSKTRSILSIISLISYVLTKVSVTVYAGGKVLQTVMGLNFWVGAILLVVVTGIYTIFGGLKSVLYTSVLQTPILLIGSLIVTVIGLVQLGGWGELQATLGAEHFQIFKPIDHPNFPWTGMLFGSTIIGAWYWCTDQYIVQRTLSAPDQKTARRGSIFAAYLKLLPVFIFMIPGMIALALSKKGLLDLGSSDAAFPALVHELLPIGVKGIVIGGLIAALMSSLASLFNSSATLFTADFYKKYRPDKPEKHYVKIGRIATGVVVVLGIVWVPVMKVISNVLYEYLQNVQSLLAPAIFAVFLLGITSKRVNSKGALWGMSIGFGLGMLRLLLDILEGTGLLTQGNFLYGIVAINWLHFCIILFIISVAVIYGVSLMTERPSDEKLQGLTFKTVSDEDAALTRSSWNGWDIFHTVVVAGVVLAVYIIFN